MPTLTSLAIRVANVEAMVDFYSQAFGVEFRQVSTYGIGSHFAEIDGILLKFVPIRDEADFKSFPVHQLGFTVPDVEAVIALALQHGGKQEGRLIRIHNQVQAAIRDPDGNTIELYSAD